MYFFKTCPSASVTVVSPLCSVTVISVRVVSPVLRPRPFHLLLRSTSFAFEVDLKSGEDGGKHLKSGEDGGKHLKSGEDGVDLIFLRSTSFSEVDRSKKYM